MRDHAQVAVLLFWSHKKLLFNSARWCGLSWVRACALVTCVMIPTGSGRTQRCWPTRIRNAEFSGTETVIVRECRYPTLNSVLHLKLYLSPSDICSRLTLVPTPLSISLFIALPRSHLSRTDLYC